MSGDAIAARFVNGYDAQIRDVTVRLPQMLTARRSELEIVDNGRVLDRWPLNQVREVRDAAGDDVMTLRCDDGSEARLMIENSQSARHIRAAVPTLQAVSVPKGQVRRVGGWAVGAVGAVLLIVFVFVPLMADRLATLIPVAQEQRLGEAVIGQITWAIERLDGTQATPCDHPDGVAALSLMTDRLTAGVETPVPVSFRVMDHPMVNAFAVPGGHIVIFDGLVQNARSAEELAGVLSHEIGHVVNRDPTRLALRSAGTVGILGLLIGDFTGGAVALILSEQLVTASYAQAAEASADRFAYRTLKDAGLPSTPLAGLFERMATAHGDSDGLLSHLASHPSLATRAAAARAADAFAGRRFQPVLAAEDWAALQRICDPAPVDAAAATPG